MDDASTIYDALNGPSFDAGFDEVDDFSCLIDLATRAVAFAIETVDKMLQEVETGGFNRQAEKS